MVTAVFVITQPKTVALSYRLATLLVLTFGCDFHDLWGA